MYEAVRPRRRRKASLATSTTSSNDGRRLSLSRRVSDFGYDSESVSPPESSEADYQFPPTPTSLHHGSNSWNAPSPASSYPLFSPTESLFTVPDLGHVEELAEDIEDGAEDGDGYVAAESWTNQTTAVTTVSQPTTSYFPDLAMIAPCPVTSPLFEFHSPAFSEFTDRPNRRALVDHFCNILSHLIVFREESGNPFQQLVLPLTRQSSPVLNAIFALASAHLEYRGVRNDEHSLFFHNQAIQGLGRLIEQSAKGNRNEILATIMLLIYYEVVSSCTRLSSREVIIANSALSSWSNEDDQIL